MEYHLKTQGIPWRETQRDEETLGKHNDHCKEKARRSEGECLGQILRHCVVADQRRKLEHLRREVSDTSDASDNSSEADRRCEEGGKDVFASSAQLSFFSCTR